MLNIGVIGYGYWGPNIVRNFNAIDGAKVISLCDLNEGCSWQGQEDLSGYGNKHRCK